MNIGLAVRTLRVYTGWSQSDYARLVLKISGSYLSEIERGRKRPSLGLLNRMASSFNVSMSDLIALSEKMPSMSPTERFDAAIELYKSKQRG